EKPRIFRPCAEERPDGGPGFQVGSRRSRQLKTVDLIVSPLFRFTVSRISRPAGPTAAGLAGIGHRPAQWQRLHHHLSLSRRLRAVSGAAVLPVVSVRRIAFLTGVVECPRKEGLIMTHGKPRDPRKERQWRHLRRSVNWIRSMQRVILRRRIISL